MVLEALCVAAEKAQMRKAGSMTRDIDSDDSPVVPRTSRRTLLRAIAAAPVAVSASPWGEALASLHTDYDDDPAKIVRTKAGRALSRDRYHRAESFLPTQQFGEWVHWHGYLYHAGITAQLALSSHLLDVGFADDWCARYIGLRVAKSLTYANATGFGHDCPDMARLAAVLTPYGRWNQVRLRGEPEPDDDGLTAPQVNVLLRNLLDRVRDVTGHPRPRGRRKR